MATIWEKENAAVGAQPVRTVAPSGNQSGAWARENAAVASRLPSYATPAQATKTSQQIIQDIVLKERNAQAGPTIERANQSPFLKNAVISAPAPQERGLGLQDITISRPTGIYSTDTGLPIIDVGKNPQITTGPKTGFLGKMFAGAANVALGAISGLSNSLGNLWDITILNDIADDGDIELGPGGFAYYKNDPPIGVENGKSTGKPVPIMYPGLSDRLKQGLPAKPTGAENLAAVLNVGAAGAGAAFAPISAELAAAEEIPIIGKPIFGTISKGFELLDHAGRWAGSKLLDVLPVDDATKATLRQPVEDLAGIVGTLFLVKGLHKVGETGGGRVVDALPVRDVTKANIKSGVSGAVGLTLQPFSTAYKGISTSIRSKVEARQARGEEVTPEVAKIIVNEAVKETVTPDVPSVMEIPTKSGSTERLYTNQKLVLQNLIRGREDLNYRVVDDLGVSMNTGKPITSRFEWDYKNQRGTIYTTNKTQAVDLARELGHYVDRKLGSGLSTRLSDVLPEYRAKRDEVNQMLADYALDRLGGNATHAEISAEVLRIADNIRAEIESATGRTLEKAKAKEFSETFGGVIDNPQARSASPEMAQLANFVLGQDVARKGAPDVEGAPGSRQEAESTISVLEQAKRENLKAARENPAFQEQRLKDQIKREGIYEQGDVASANFNWREMVKGIRDSKEFKKEGTITDSTINGVMMEKGGKYRLVPHSEVKAMQRNGWNSRFSMDEIAHANGFERAEDYTTYIMELDTQLRSISRSSEQKAAHEFLMKNDPNYANLNRQIDTLREQLTSEETNFSRQEQGSESNQGQVPTAEPQAQGRVEAPREAQTTETVEVPSSEPTPRIEREASSGGGARGKTGVAESIARKTVEQKLEDSFKDVAGYDKITIEDQTRRAADLVFNDLERAKRVMTGQEPLPDGLRAGMLIKTLEEYAMKTGDAELAFELANSPLVAETSLYAQEMRLLAERTPDSATAQLQSVRKAREAAALENLRKGQTLFEATKKAKSELNDAIKKSRPTKENWNSFIDSIKC